MPDLRIPRGSVEYVKVPIAADVDLDAQTVTISIDNRETWLQAQWVGSVGKKRFARTSSPVTFADRATHQVFAKLTDAPEAPILRAGNIVVS